MNKSLALAALLALTCLSACSAQRVSDFPSYKLAVVQGNELDPRAVASLRAGLSREQVRLLLGTPMLRDPFHANRWDYTFETSRNGVVKDLRNLTLTFQDDQLIKAEGNAIDYAMEQLQKQYGATIRPAEQPAEQPAAPEPLWTPAN